MQLEGLHHITAITGDAPRNVAFYADTLGLRLVKKTVNFDQPDVAANLWRNPGESGGGREANGVDDDGNGFVDDYYGWDFFNDNESVEGPFWHGTAVTGIISA